MKPALVVALCIVSATARADRPPAPDSSTSVPSGPADTRHIIGVLDIRVDGIPDDVKQAFQSALEHEPQRATERVAQADAQREQQARADRDLLRSRAVDHRILRERQRRLPRRDQQRDEVALPRRPTAVVVLADGLLQERVVRGIEPLRACGSFFRGFGHVGSLAEIFGLV